MLLNHHAFRTGDILCLGPAARRILNGALQNLRKSVSTCCYCLISNFKGAVMFQEKTRPFVIGDGEYDAGEKDGLYTEEDWLM